MKSSLSSLVLAVCMGGLLAGCATPSRRATSELPPGGGLVAEARHWRMENGLPVAREKLDARLMELDAKDGWFERRIWVTNADKSHVYPDSMATLELERRSEVGIFLMLGYRQTGRKSPAIVARVAEALREQGWNAALIRVPNRGTAAENALLIQNFLEPELPKVKRAILVGFSKGGYDLLEWMKSKGGQLPETERDKIRLVVNFAGALRGSAVAAWGAGDDALPAKVFRGMLAMQALDGADGCGDLHSVSVDPWHGEPDWRPRAVLPRLRAIHYVVLPEGPDGHTNRNKLFGTIGRLAEKCFDGKIGPQDGLVESAAQVYPEQAKLPQWIVRVRGSHATMDGQYANGARVSDGYALGGQARLDSGRELLDDLLRALPRAVIDF